MAPLAAHQACASSGACRDVAQDMFTPDELQAASVVTPSERMGAERMRLEGVTGPKGCVSMLKFSYAKPHAHNPEGEEW
eukprot:CAMPEP_0183354428 /NCGR_PEP_ID=MMETSP0164_2-20130417/37308_1 /TAXON_ID=221442 /ORGANISM="Coccolithus pelagicus ssp braarudi, Strain PLY182g" /LENGTH=78 /DNA_ID=CAMNT_0025527307 /DNA_START=188 /DNA_END=422 /DNA_ORIENTATION=-